MEAAIRVVGAKRWCLRTYRDGAAQEPGRGGGQASVGGPEDGGGSDGGQLLSLGTLGAQLAALGAPAAAGAPAVLVVVEFRVISGSRLGAAIQEVGERVGYKSRLGG